MASLTHIKHPSVHLSIRPAILLSIEWKVSLNQAQVVPSFEWENNNKTAKKEQQKKAECTFIALLISHA